MIKQLLRICCMINDIRIRPINKSIFQRLLNTQQSLGFEQLSCRNGEEMVLKLTSGERLV